jgi:membrane dipeptidase
MLEENNALHSRAIVIDAVCPLLFEPKYIELYKRGGATVVAPTVATNDTASSAARTIGNWLRFIRERDDLMLVRTASDIELAKRTEKVGILFHFQGADALEDNLDLVDVFKALGVGMIQLTYNVKNRVGDGCEERTDAGLSKFGVRFVKRMNEARVIVDCSHTGYHTTMEAIEVSSAPVVFSHANPRAVHNCNIRDDQIKAVAATGGLVGVLGYPAFVSSQPQASLPQFVSHIDYVVELVGIDHVALGIDYFLGQHPIMNLADAQRLYGELVARNLWDPANYPPPPYRYPHGIDTPEGFPNLTRFLLERGYKADEVLKIMGENWVRVFRAVWGGQS